jgi:hypothetical protein
MAELVDALGSGPSDGNIVEVRVFFRAPKHKKIAQAVFFVFRSPAQKIAQAVFFVLRSCQVSEK